MQLNTARRSEEKAFKRSVRARTIQAMHVTWKKLRRDLHDPEESREQRLAFMVSVLNLKKPLESSRDLTDKQLGRVLDAMRRLESQPELPGAQNIHVQSPRSKVQSPEGEAEIYHLATEAQGVVLDKLFAHLGWNPEAQEQFLFKRFKRKRHRLLSPKDANKLTMILLTIGAARAIKERSNVERVSRVMIRAEIPALKRRLGIDQTAVDTRQDAELEEGL